MSRAQTVVIVAGGLAVMVAVLLYFRWGSAYSTPEVTRASLGGRWETETVRSLGGTTGGHTSLFRSVPGGRRLIAAAVFKETYVGDDCVIYGSPDGCWAACDDREPVRIVGYCDRWDIDATTFRTFEESGIATTLNIDEIKKKALESRAVVHR